jgi:hypothetical protein
MKIQPKALLGHKHAALLCACLAGSGMLLLPGQGNAQVTLSNGGSFATVNLGGGGGSGLIGMNSWEVGTDNQMQNELNQQWFWLQIGSSVYSIDQLGTPTINQQTQNFLDSEYTSAALGVSVDVQYTLNGSGVNSGSADITENITVYNNSTTSPLSVNLFEYSNFNLLGENNNVEVFPDGVGGYDYAEQYVGSTAIAEGIIAPDANNAEAGLAGNVLSAVEAGDLNGNLTAGPGDVAWAFEWSTQIDPGQNFPVLKDKELTISTVPEPSTIALIGLGLGAVGFFRRRQAP